MTQTHQPPRTAASLLRAKPFPLDETQRPPETQKEKYTPVDIRPKL